MSLLGLRFEVGGTLYELSAAPFFQSDSESGAGGAEIEAERALALALDGDPGLLLRFRGFLAGFAAESAGQRLTGEEVLRRISGLTRAGSLALVSVGDEEGRPRSAYLRTLADEMKMLAIEHLRFLNYDQEEIDRADLGFIDWFLRTLELGAEDFEHGISKLKLVISTRSKLPSLVGLDTGTGNAKAMRVRLVKLREVIARKISKSDGRHKRAALWLERVEKILKQKDPDPEELEEVEDLFEKLEDLMRRLPQPGRGAKDD